MVHTRGLKSLFLVAENLMKQIFLLHTVFLLQNDTRLLFDGRIIRQNDNEMK